MIYTQFLRLNNDDNDNVNDDDATQYLQNKY